ncbi:MAG: hypothetical protein EZS28_029631 [Streblomastix strix]|uniref:Uncharacterized protein n=1 Tax=Streblomastix strix TaxID=222440 RepID=A0A5J4UXM0_9EUKA|nr:MAG: hypothetical protein EZS28_029631 [Streblomastix strix]
MDMVKDKKIKLDFQMKTIKAMEKKKQKKQKEKEMLIVCAIVKVYMHYQKENYIGSLEREMEIDVKVVIDMVIIAMMEIIMTQKEITESYKGEYQLYPYNYICVMNNPKAILSNETEDGPESERISDDVQSEDDRNENEDEEGQGLEDYEFIIIANAEIFAQEAKKKAF